MMGGNLHWQLKPFTFGIDIHGQYSLRMTLLGNIEAWRATNLLKVEVGPHTQ